MTLHVILHISLKILIFEALALLLLASFICIFKTDCDLNTK